MAYNQARRNELSRAQGFASYSEKRKIIEYANKDTENQFADVIGEKAGGRNGAHLDDAKLYYQAFKVESPSDYSVTSAKAKWIIEKLGYVKDTEEWQRRYPRGVRE